MTQHKLDLVNTLIKICYTFNSNNTSPAEMQKHQFQDKIEKTVLPGLEITSNFYKMGFRPFGNHLVKNEFFFERTEMTFRFICTSLCLVSMDNIIYFQVTFGHVKFSQFEFKVNVLSTFDRLCETFFRICQGSLSMFSKTILSSLQNNPC